MDCFKHKGTVATSTCNVCGNWLCSDCAIEKNGRIFCGDCLGIKPSPSMHEHCHHEHIHHHHPRKHLAGARHTNGFLFFIFSFILPGINFMYLGMMKRGLFFLSTFFFTIYLTASFNLLFFPLAIPIIYITSFFDGFATRRRLENGEHVEDSINDIKMFVNKYKVHMIIAFVAIVAINLFKSTFYFLGASAGMMGRSFHHGGMGGGIFGLVCMAAIAYGIYMIGKSRGAKSSDRKRDQIDE